MSVFFQKCERNYSGRIPEIRFEEVSFTTGVTDETAKEIPLKYDYFEMQMSKTFIEGNSKSITLNWIDFYRN